MTEAADEVEELRKLKARYCRFLDTKDVESRRRRPYTGGTPEYRRRCDEIAAGGYAGFKLS
jgi:hypothetical protein